MSNNIRQAYSETYAVLQVLQCGFLSKVPIDLIQFLRNEKDDTYNVTINSSIPLEKQNLLPETISLLAMLKLNYWCENEKEKKELLDIFDKNEKEYQNNLLTKYNYENLFNKQTKFNIQNNIEEHQLIAYKEPLLKKLFKKFLSFYNK